MDLYRPPISQRSTRSPIPSRCLSPNQLLFSALVLLLVIAPLPLASARAVFWGMNAVYVGGLAIIYLLWLSLAGKPMRRYPRAFWVAGIAFSSFCLYLAFQVLTHSTIAPDMTFLMLLRQITYGLFFLLMLQALTREDRRQRLMTVLLLVIAAYAAYGLISLRTGDTILGMAKWTYPGMATGTFTNRNAFATFLAMGAAIGAAQLGSLLAARWTGALTRLTAHSVLLPTLCTAAIVLTLLATQSRMGIFVGFVGIALGLLLTIGRVLRPLHLGLGAVLVVLLLAGPFLVYFGDTLIDRMRTLEGAFSGRGSLYLQVMHLIGLHPLTGFGGGSFELAFPQVQAAPLDPAVTWDRAHNMYLALWSETGLIAGSIPILLVALFALGVALRFSKASRRSDIVSQAAALAVVAIVAVHSLVDFGLEIQGNAFVFLAILANGLASAYASDSSQASTRR